MHSTQHHVDISAQYIIANTHTHKHAPFPDTHVHGARVPRRHYVSASMFFSDVRRHSISNAANAASIMYDYSFGRFSVS